MIEKINLNYVLVILIAFSAIFAVPAKAESQEFSHGYHKVLTTKDCLVFLEDNDGESRSAHLLPKSYARCLALTRKYLRKQKQEKLYGYVSSDGTEGENNGTLEKEDHASQARPKKYYRVQKSKE